MPLATFPILLAVAIIVTMASMIYLIINARGLADLFRRTQMEPGPGRKRVSRGSIVAALVLFNLGWLACVGIWWTTWSNAANAVIESEGKDTAGQG